MSDSAAEIDRAEFEAAFNRLAESLVSRPDDEIREALTRFWEDNLDPLDENMTDWIEDVTGSLANGELVTLDLDRLP